MIPAPPFDLTCLNALAATAAGISNRRR